MKKPPNLSFLLRKYLLIFALSAACDNVLHTKPHILLTKEFSDRFVNRKKVCSFGRYSTYFLEFSPSKKYNQPKGLRKLVEMFIAPPSKKICETEIWFSVLSESMVCGTKLIILRYNVVNDAQIDYKSIWWEQQHKALKLWRWGQHDLTSRKKDRWAANKKPSKYHHSSVFIYSWFKMIRLEKISIILKNNLISRGAKFRDGSWWILTALPLSKQNGVERSHKPLAGQTRLSTAKQWTSKTPGQKINCPRWRQYSPNSSFPS